jgi:antitoxin (DNA-binding transcriptional repressor) of toxin-antitoxin stability system
MRAILPGGGAARALAAAPRRANAAVLTADAVGWLPPKLPVMEVTVDEAQSQLPRLLRLVEAGETIVIRRGEERVAVLGPAPPETGHRRISGDVQGRIGADFDEPLEDLARYR